MIKASYSKRTLFFKQPAGTSRGVLQQKDVFYFILKNAENQSKEGIGEIAPIPGLSIDAVPELEEKIKSLVNKINAGEEIKEIDFERFPAVKFGYETAMMGINSYSPIVLYPSDFLIGKKGIPINGLIWMGSKKFMLQQVDDKIAAGFTCLKLKIGAINFTSELEILRSIRENYPVEKLEIRVDANGAFTPENAKEKLEQLAAFHLHSIEQPIQQGQTKEMQKLCAETPLPIALDEELIGIDKLSEKIQLLEQILPQYIILKPTLLGGIKACEDWISRAKERNIGWWVTSALESNIGLNAIAQWTATLDTTNFQGLGTGELFTNNIVSPLYVSEGKLRNSIMGYWNLNPIEK
jgi:o-succinylbenzoate synthase